jgi:hypothetical protein
MGKGVTAKEAGKMMNDKILKVLTTFARKELDIAD